MKISQGSDAINLFKTLNLPRVWNTFCIAVLWLFITIHNHSSAHWAWETLLRLLCPIFIYVALSPLINLFFSNFIACGQCIKVSSFLIFKIRRTVPECHWLSRTFVWWWLDLNLIFELSSPRVKKCYITLKDITNIGSS